MTGIHPLRKLIIAGALALVLCSIHFGWYVEALAERDALGELARVRARGTESLQNSIEEVVKLRHSIAAEEQSLDELRGRIRATPTRDMLGDEFLRVLRKEGGRIQRLTPGESRVKSAGLSTSVESLIEEKFELVYSCTFESLIRCLRAWESLRYTIRLEKLAIVRGSTGELNVELVCSSLRAGRAADSSRP